MQGIAFRITALVGFVAVALGAFGAHGFRNILLAHDTVAIWQTAVLYHLVHTVGMLVLASAQRWRPGPWWAFALGIVIFSGSLYVLALSNLKILGAITPFGGVAFLVGWGWLACSGLKPGVKANEGT